MASGWDVYYIVFLSGVLALGFPLCLAGISFLVSPRARGAARARREGRRDSLKGLSVKRRVNTRFFLAVNVSIILLALSFFLIPCAGVLKSLEASGDREVLVRALVAIFTIAGFLSLALFYSARKGDLGWLNTYRGPEKK